MTGTAIPTTSEALVLPPDPRAAREARRLAARMCATAGLVDDLSDVAELLISEVVTNVVVHARTEARVSVTVGPGHVVVEVGDDDERPPVLRPDDETALGGRGIGLLQASATAWGVRPEPGGKVVWFSLGA